MTARQQIVLCALLLLGAMQSQLHAQSSGRGSAASRIAFVRGEVLFDSIPSRSQVEARFGDEVRLAETRVRLASDTLRAAVDWFSAQQNQMAPMQRESAMLTLRARELQLEDMVQQLNIRMQEKREALEAPLTLCVQGALERVRAREGWHAIVDVSTMGPVVAIAAEVDVTNNVLRAMRELTPGVCGNQ